MTIKTNRGWSQDAYTQSILSKAQEVTISGDFGEVSAYLVNGRENEPNALDIYVGQDQPPIYQRDENNQIIAQTILIRMQHIFGQAITDAPRGNGGKAIVSSTSGTYGKLAQEQFGHKPLAPSS